MIVAIHRMSKRTWQWRRWYSGRKILRDNADANFMRKREYVRAMVRDDSAFKFLVWYERRK